MPSGCWTVPGLTRWAVGVAAVLAAGGLAVVIGWKLRQTAYDQTQEELLQRTYLVEPVLRGYLNSVFGASSPAAKWEAESLRREEVPAERFQSGRKPSGFPVSANSSAKTPLTIQQLCVQMGRASQTRITLILPDGTVLGESEEKPDLMEPHTGRPEIVQALQGQPATSLRYSSTLRQWMFYAAVPIRNGEQICAILRLSQPKESVDRRLRRQWLWIGLVAGFLACLGIVVGFWSERPFWRSWKSLLEVGRRLAEGDYTTRINEQGPEDLRQLVRHLHQLAQLLQGRHRTLQAQESELQAILGSMSEGVLAVDSQGRLLCLNQSAAELLGLEGTGQVGRPLEEIMRHPELHRLVAEVLAHGEPVVGQLQLPGPPVRQVQLQATVLQAADGEQLGALVVLRDVTRLRQLENLRRDFVANVSHELKTPLTSIQGFVEALLDGALEDREQAERFLKIIAAQTQRLQNLLEDLLSLSRIEQEAETQQIRLEAGPIREVLASAVELCRPKAEEKQIPIHLDCPENLQVPRNAALLEQAVVNLLDNAIKYSPESQPVHLQAFQEGQEVVIRVQDHGCGIPPEHLDRIFERFYRVDKARSRKLGGTGLGLAIVKHIALAHGGRVAVQSQVGQGSTFSIYLPIQSPPDATPRAPARKK